MVGAAVAASVVLQGLSLLSPSAAEVDPEELYNAGVAWMIGHGHARSLFAMQYREYCGGCSLDAVIGAPLLRVLGPRWLAWKLVPLSFTAALAGGGAWLLDRRAGRAAALAFAACLALAPRAWQHLSLIGWGNHVEAGIVGTLGLLLATTSRTTPARIAAGAALGCAVWVGFSGVFAPIAATALLLGRRDPRAAATVLAGIPLGLLPWAAQYGATGLHPFVTVYQDGESAPALSRIPHKVQTLLAPGQLVALLGVPSGTVGHLLGWTAAASIGSAGLATLRDRARGLAGAALAGLSVWVAVYLVVRFQIHDPPWPAIAVPGSVRYAAPIYPLLLVLVAAVAGRWWSEGRRASAAILLAPLLTAGAAARFETLGALASPARVAGLGAVDWDYFRPQFSYTLTDAEHAASAEEDIWSRRVHSYALGRNDAGMKLRNPSDGTLARVRRPAVALKGPFWEGVGEALVAQLDDDISDTRALLAAAEVLLEGAPGADADARSTALRAAAWARREAPDQPGLHGTAAARWRAQATSPGLRDALAWAHARHQGRARSGWHGTLSDGLIEDVLSADCPGRSCAAATEGLALGLGEELGPDGVPHTPQEVSDPEAWQRGLTAAWTRWWPGSDTF